MDSIIDLWTHAFMKVYIYFYDVTETADVYGTVEDIIIIIRNQERL